MIQPEKHDKQATPKQPGLKAHAEVAAQEWVNQTWSKANIVSLSIWTIYLAESSIFTYNKGSLSVDFIFSTM